MKKDEPGLTQVMLEDLAAQSISNAGSSTDLILSPASLSAFRSAFSLSEWDRTETGVKINQAWIHNDNIDYTDYTVMSHAFRAFYKLGLERSLLK